MSKILISSARVDKWLVVWIIASILFGLWMVYSVTAFQIVESGLGSTPSNFLAGQFGKQLLGICIGSVLAIYLASLDQEVIWKNHKNVIFVTLVVIALLILVALIGVKIKGGQRWLSLPGFTLQPSEFFKPVAVILTIFIINLEDRPLGSSQKSDWVLVGKLLLILMVPLFLIIIKQPDLGTGIAIIFVVLGVLYSANLHRNVFLSLCAFASTLIAYTIIFKPFRFQRVQTWLTTLGGPEYISDPTGAGHQVKQALIAVGNGGLFGVGPGAGRQKLYFLPESDTDYIFAVIGEELGLIGSLIVVGLFVVIMSRCFKIITKANTQFTKLLALGMTLIIIFQALFNISVVVSLLPSKGIPLPFISYGANSVISSLICVGILLSISKQTQKDY